MEERKIIKLIQDKFPSNRTIDVAEELNLSPYQVRTIAKKNNIVKCKKYQSQLKKQLILNRKRWYEANIPVFNPTHFQEQIIFGSLLGDGYISRGGKRSVNYYYQEHFGERQREYRLWKLKKLKDLGFSMNGNFFRSKSHPYFTSLYPLLYRNGVKSLTNDFITKCTHPIFLFTLYLDDGSLTISYSYNATSQTVYCHPRITLYTLNFTRNENVKLASHLNLTFGTNFVVSNHPDGKGSLLRINKEKDVTKLLNIIRPFVAEITSMKYKTCLVENIKRKNTNIKKKFGDNVKIKISSSDRKKMYSNEEINKITKMKNAGYTDQQIANLLGRSYWSVVYKISELRKEGLL